MNEELVKKCTQIIDAFKSGKLGQTIMPEDCNPGFSTSENEMRLAYFTLPMALNYQRDSYKLWEGALKTFNDIDTKKVFDCKEVSYMNEEDLRRMLLKYKVALQPNKHINTWKRVCSTVYQNWGSFEGLLHASDNDFLKLKQLLQIEHKKGFPYLSGVKIFNYWSFILCEYGKVQLKNKKFIDIAPDTHITKCSVILGVITETEAQTLSKEKISEIWRDALDGSDISPIDMHSPLWFWSRNGFIYQLD